ncbi:MAG TPA: GntR family transcriptional regulator [Rhizobiaceae bacterium]|nr:GntR family transcriptional regulator [Rhizobiaceae bacterium]
MVDQSRLSANSLHEGVRDEILKRIADGQYAEGGAIPSAALLSEEFSVSAITVKRALRDLQTSGALIAVAGKGTFVKRRQRFLRELDIGMSSMDNARRKGLTLTVDRVSVTREKIVDSTLLEFDAGRDLRLCVRKVILADGIPIMHDTTYFSNQLPDDLVEDFGRYIITEALKRHGIELAETRLVIDALPATAEAQQAFSIPSGYPMLRRVYCQKTTHDDMTVLGLAESPFDRLACTITLPTGGLRSTGVPA